MPQSKSILFVMVFSIFIAACSQTPKKNNYSIKTPAQKLTFEQLERQRALETYKKLRLRAIERAKHRKKHFTKRRKIKTVRKKIKKVAVKSIPDNIIEDSEKKLVETAPIIPSYPKKDPKEILIEVEQNLAIFCMRHRKHSKFKDESDCVLFTQEKLKECQDKHIETDNARLIGCVKSRLRL